MLITLEILDKLQSFLAGSCSHIIFYVWFLNFLNFYNFEHFALLAIFWRQNSNILGHICLQTKSNSNVTFFAIFKQCNFGRIFEILSALIFQLLSLDILCINSNFRDEFVQLAFRDPLCVIFWCAVCHIYKRIQSKAEITTGAEFAFHTKDLPLDPHQLHSSRSPSSCSYCGS